MLKAIRQFLIRGKNESAKPEISPVTSSGSAGYFMLASADQLLVTHSRKQGVRQLWENCALPKDLYERFYLQPLMSLASLMQALPAAQQGEYARDGGLIDVTLQTTTFAVRLAKGHMLPPGAASEEQSAQSVLWNAVVFYAALIYYLPILDQFEGELQSGRIWLPGVTVPAESYRFRFKACPSQPELATSQSALITARLLPQDAIAWLSTLPTALQTLMLIISRQPSPLPVIDELIQEAVKLARGNHLSVVPLADYQNTPAITDRAVKHMDLQTAASVKPLTETLLSSALDTSVNEIPSDAKCVTPNMVSNMDDDTQALLSLMANELPIPVNSPLKETEEVGVDGVNIIVQNDALATPPEDAFWGWLSSGLQNGIIEVNTVVARAHIVSSFVFLCIPEIFHLHIKETGMERTARNSLQKAFEKPGKHHIREGQRFFTAHLYQQPTREGTYRQITGYLVKANSLYGSSPVPENSQLLVIP